MGSRLETIFLPTVDGADNFAELILFVSLRSKRDRRPACLTPPHRFIVFPASKCDLAVFLQPTKVPALKER